MSQTAQQTEPAPRPPALPGADAQPAMAQSVGRGMTWMLMNSAVGRTASLLAQWVVGLLLLPADFGIMSITIAIAAFVQVFRDGGIPRYIVQQGPEAFRRDGSTLFWMAFAFNCATAVMLAIAAPVAGRVYGDPQITHLLLIMALVPPVGTPAMLALAKLNMEMRFESIAKISAASQVVRHASTVLLAWQGMGVYALILPMLITAVFDSAAYSLAARHAAWKGPANPGRWLAVFRATGWLMVGMIASSTYNMGEYLVLPMVVTKDVQGFYMFGYLLSRQILIVVLLNLQVVLLPSLSRVVDDPERFRLGVLRALRLLMLVAAPFSFGLACIADPLIRTLWPNGRWDSAILVVQTLSVVMALNVMCEIPRTMLMSVGRFGLWCGIVTADMLGLIGAALFGGWLTTDAAGAAFFAGEARDPFGVALAVAAYSLVVSPVICAVALRAVGIPATSMFRQVAPALGAGLACAVLTIAVDSALAGAVPPPARLLAAGALYSAAFIGLARWVLRADLRDVLSIAPGRVRPQLQRFFGLA